MAFLPSRRVGSILLTVYVAAFVLAAVWILGAPSDIGPGARKVLLFVMYGTGLPLVLVTIGHLLEKITTARVRQQDKVIEAAASSSSSGLFDVESLIGCTGTALSALHPGGYVLVGSQRFDAVTQGEFIAKDTPIRVIACKEGNFLVVCQETQV